MLRKCCSEPRLKSLTFLLFPALSLEVQRKKLKPTVSVRYRVSNIFQRRDVSIFARKISFLCLNCQCHFCKYFQLWFCSPEAFQQTLYHTELYRVSKTIFCVKKCLYLFQFWSYTKILEYGKVWELYILFKPIKFFWKFLKFSRSLRK